MPSIPVSSAENPMPVACTPQELILGRAAALSGGDFAAIFASYHPDAPFLRFFPDRAAYLAYAASELAGVFRISHCRILRLHESGETVEVLFSQSIEHGGVSVESLEIGRCRRDPAGEWRFEAGLRLDPQRLPADLEHAPWSELIAAGSNLWI